MFKTHTIKKITAIFLLIVFAFSITPTIVFHNWLAGHIDTTGKTQTTPGEQLGKITFNCHCDNIIAESPFTVSPSQVFILGEQPYSNRKVELNVQPNAPYHQTNYLRGPPVI